MKDLPRRAASAALLALLLPGQPAALASQWVPVAGYVYADSTPLCALVLANGQTQFSCDGTGRYQLQVPLDENGRVTVMAFADGFAPFTQILPPDQAGEYQVAMIPDQQGPSLRSYASVSPSAQDGRYVLSGIVVSGSRPVCALVLANGSSVFSCGESHGQLSLDVPADDNGDITLMVFATGFQPYKKILVADPDTDEDGIVDRVDDDDDNDGLFDADDACPLLPDQRCPEPITETVLVAGREWAQVDLFTGLSWIEVNTACPDGACLPGAVLNGKDMTGWTWASASNFNRLVNHYLGADELGLGYDQLETVPGPPDEPGWFGAMARAFRYSDIHLPWSYRIVGWLPEPSTSDTPSALCPTGMVGVDTYYEGGFNLVSWYRSTSRGGQMCEEGNAGTGAWFYRDLQD